MSTHAVHSRLGRVGHSRSRRHVSRRMALMLFAAVLVLVGAIAGYKITNNQTGNSQVITEARSVSAGNASTVMARLAMQPGNLQISGGASRLLDARFVYQPAAWRPTVTYRVTGSRGQLSVRQPHLQAVTSSRNTWDVRLSDRMPTDLVVTSGPGNATLGLRRLMLDTLTVVAGPGNVTIDARSPSLRTARITAGPGNLTVNLDAPWKHNVSAIVDGGIGNTTLRLPTTIGVQVAVQGMGQVTAPGFARQGDSYVNAAFGKASVAVHVSLTAGIGNVVLATGA